MPAAPAAPAVTRSEVIAIKNTAPACKTVAHLLQSVYKSNCAAGGDGLAARSVRLFPENGCRQAAAAGEREGNKNAPRGSWRGRKRGHIMKKRILSILLCLCMVLMLCPVAAFAEETGTLAITVDNFEVGKTPADITFSFASTNLGVTFSKDDVAVIKWFMIDAEGWVHEHLATSEFEADTTYGMVIGFEAKDLTSAPTVTVNGKTARAVQFSDDPYLLIVNHRFDKLTPITIDGPDVVCAKQDYEFTVTAAAGVTLDTQFGYNTGSSGRSADLEIDDDGVGHGTVSVEWYDLQTNCFTLTAQGTGPNGNTVRGTKTVRVSPEHLYVDGVCGCGAVQIVTVTAPFTITVKQGGSAAPGKTVFELEVIDSQGNELIFDGVEVTAAVTTNGKGTYKGTMTFTGSLEDLDDMLGEGAFVRQVNEGKANWTYDDTVWWLRLFDGAAYASTDDAAPGYTVLIFPTSCEETDDGGKVYRPDWSKDPLKQMSFTNIYTKSTYKPSESGTNTGTITSPQTGDNSNLAVWFALLAVSAAGVMGAGVYSKRRRSSR